jgi:hypothetical protein
VDCGGMTPLWFYSQALFPPFSINGFLDSSYKLLNSGLENLEEGVFNGLYPGT